MDCHRTRSPYHEVDDHYLPSMESLSYLDEINMYNEHGSSPKYTQLSPSHQYSPPMTDHASQPFMDLTWCDNSFETMQNLLPPQPHAQQQPRPVPEPVKNMDLTHGMGQLQQRTPPYPMPCQDPFLSWTNTHCSNWSVAQVLDWLYHLVGQNYIHDAQHFHGEVFNNVTGRDLCSMTKQQFVEKTATHGERIYNLFQDLRTQSEFTQPRLLEGETINTDLNSSVQFSNMYNSQYDYDQCDTFADLPVDQNQNQKYNWNDHLDEGYDTPSSSSDMDSEPPNSPAYYACNYSQQASPLMAPLTKSARGRGGASRGTGKGSLSSKGNHLWEFVRDLLKNKECNPKLIKWEDERDGVFRFVQSEQVAKMWGQRKNNPNMTYEKLSRAMRFCRQAEYFSAVPKTGRFPKKLVFRFGPKASGWQEN